MSSELKADSTLGEARITVAGGRIAVADRRGVEREYPLGETGVAALGFVRDQRTGALRATKSDQFVVLTDDSKIQAFSQSAAWDEVGVRSFAEANNLRFEELTVTNDDPAWPAFAKAPFSLEISDRAGKIWLGGALVLALALASPLLGAPAALSLGIAVLVLLAALGAVLMAR